MSPARRRRGTTAFAKRRSEGTQHERARRPTEIHGNRASPPAILRACLVLPDRAALRGGGDHRHADDGDTRHHREHLADWRVGRHGAGAGAAGGVRALPIGACPEPRAECHLRRDLRRRQQPAAADRHSLRAGPARSCRSVAGRRRTGDVPGWLPALPDVRFRGVSGHRRLAARCRRRRGDPCRGRGRAQGPGADRRRGGGHRRQLVARGADVGWACCCAAIRRCCSTTRSWLASSPAATSTRPMSRTA
jgi:hypothetical protein